MIQPRPGAPTTIEETLAILDHPDYEDGRDNPIITTALFRDIATRILALEALPADPPTHGAT